MEARNTGVSINYFIRGKTIFIRGQEWCADFIAKMQELLNDSYNLSTILLSQHKFNVLNERRRQADVSNRTSLVSFFLQDIICRVV